MKTEIAALYNAMISYMAGDADRIKHFAKVHDYSSLIGTMEHLDAHTQFILEAAALMHDIGIREGERLYGRNDGQIQEQLGPAEAERLLDGLGFEKEDIKRICYLIGHHHTYHSIDGTDYQILVEADFLVNLQEENSSMETCMQAYRNIFRTGTGKMIMEKMFGLGNLSNAQ